MADVVGITIVKSFMYRGAVEEWSNTYHLTGDVPADDVEWDTLVWALIQGERECYTEMTTVERAYGYDSDSDTRHAVFSTDYHDPVSPLHGNLDLSGTSHLRASGDVAATVRWKTSRTVSSGPNEGKAIYLRKYFHDVYAGDGSTPDVLEGTQKTAMSTFANSLRDGSLPDARTIRSRSLSDVIVDHRVDPYLTTRTLKKRSRRLPP